MGQIADEIHEGHRCQYCCQPLLDGRGDGVPRSCAICKVVDERENRSLQQRTKRAGKMLRGPAHKTTKRNLDLLKEYGTVRQCNAHHWQIRSDGLILDWWPAKGKWSLNNAPAEAGDLGALICVLKVAKAPKVRA